MTTKQAVIDMIQRLPDDVTVTDIMSELYVRQKVDEGLRQLDAGDASGHRKGLGECDGSATVDDSWADIIDHEIIATAERESEGEIPLEELRDLLSSIQGSMSDVVIEERGDY